MVLTRQEVDDTRLFTLLLVGCVYGDEDDADGGASFGVRAQAVRAQAVAASAAAGTSGGGGGGSSSSDDAATAGATAAPVTHGEPVTRGEPTVVADASEYARRKGLHFLETAVNTNEELHRLMVSLVQQIIGKLVARRRREQLHEAALKQLAEALEPAGFLKSPDADALWRAVEQAKEVGIPESRLLEARKKLAEIEEKERGGFLGLGHLGKLIPGCAGDRRTEKGKTQSVPGEAPPTARERGAAPTVEGGKKSDLV
jgi:hypothetical protein